MSMANNKFYQPGLERSERVRRLFQQISKHYDLVNDLQSCGLHRIWKREMVRGCEVEQGVKALDVCCGTGDISLRLAEKGAKVVGLDFSDSMLDVARKRRIRFEGKNQTGSVEFVQGDALNLSFDDETFDIVTIAYGLRNLADFNAGLQELWRVLKPKGRLAILDLGKPASPFWRAVFNFQLKFLIPWFGRVFYRDAETYAYLGTSLQHYPAQEGIVLGLEQLGAESVRQIEFLGGIMSLHLAVKAE